MPATSDAPGILPAVRAKRVALLCQVGSLVCGLAVEHVSETMRPLPLEPLDGMPPFVAGLAIIRGAAVPVVDLARLLGHDSSARRTRFVVVKVDERRVALAVERVIGVRVLDAVATSSMPPLLGDASADFVAAVGSLDARFLMILESTRILPASLWATLERGGQA
jgi:purine-binding chemotaxis protein CheW